MFWIILMVAATCRASSPSISPAAATAPVASMVPPIQAPPSTLLMPMALIATGIATIKMIQNILIGVVAFCVAIYWVLRVEGKDSGTKPSVMEIWRRFPKFILGFVMASVVFSVLYSTLADGPQIINAVIKGSTKTFRGWFFCLAFVSIGLETNFRELAKYFKGGKPLVLYIVGQSFNLCLTLLMVWLMFTKVFPNALEALQK